MMVTFVQIVTMMVPIPWKSENRSWKIKVCFWRIDYGNNYYNYERIFA